MRRMKMCEEMGTGWDRIIIECEKMFLPSPRLESINSYTKVTILGKISFKEMDREDKIWACYTHACVMHASGQRITNTTLRERFGLGNDAVVAISHLLKQTCDEGLIKCFEKGQKKNQSYIPSWA